MLTPRPFEPPTLVASRSSGRLADDHADQLATAMEQARAAGLAAARDEVDRAVARHEAARAELELVSRALHAAVRELDQRDSDVVDALGREAVDVAVELAEQLIGRELSSCDDVVVGSIAGALALVPDRGAIVLRVHPSDQALARVAIEEQTALAGRIELLADPAVERGGSVAVVGPLRIDAQVGPALARVRAQLDPSG